MTHKIIQTEKYLLVVDDSEIKEGDWFHLDMSDNDRPDEIHQMGINKRSKTGGINFSEPNSWTSCCKKIIAHLPLNNSPTLEGIDLLPPLEDEAEVMAEEYSKNYYYDNAQDDVYHGFFQGYKKAKERFKYTEKDMREAFKAGQLDKGNNWYGGDFNQFIQSHQTKMPIGFEFETKDEYLKNGILIKTEWVGKYIFE